MEKTEGDIIVDYEDERMKRKKKRNIERVKIIYPEWNRAEMKNGK